MTTKKQETKVCPQCGRPVRMVLTENRYKREECRNQFPTYCEWVGKTYKPKKKAVRSVKILAFFAGGDWTYEIFDQYGQLYISSESFSSEATCTKSAKRNLAKVNGKNGYGRCVAVVWPPKVKIVGKRITVGLPKKR